MTASGAGPPESVPSSGRGASHGRPPILVTGMPRSGTTWLAHMLERGGEATYINEPLNPRHYPGRSPGLFRAPVRHGFQYICDENEDDFLDAYRELISFRYRPLEDIRAHRTVSDLKQVARHSARFQRARLTRRRALVADPYAVFSADWFARRLGFRVVVVVRDPAAVVSSRQRLGWGLKFMNHVLSQPLLMRDRLGPFRSDLEAADKGSGDLLDANSLTWRVIYHWVAELRAVHPDVIVVRHEDLSRDPIGEFEQLYGRLGLRFGPAASRAIERATGPQNPPQLDPERPHSVTLDSRANLDAWKGRLRPEELARIRSLTHDVASRYYTAAELALP